MCYRSQHPKSHRWIWWWSAPYRHALDHSLTMIKMTFPLMGPNYYVPNWSRLYYTCCSLLLLCLALQLMNHSRKRHCCAIELVAFSNWPMWCLRAIDPYYECLFIRLVIRIVFRTNIPTTPCTIIYTENILFMHRCFFVRIDPMDVHMCIYFWRGYTTISSGGVFFLFLVGDNVERCLCVCD